MGGSRMIIIIEGPDGAGKTTLAEQISRQTKYPIIHRTKPKNEEEKNQITKIRNERGDITANLTESKGIT